MNDWAFDHGSMMGSTGVWGVLLWLVLFIDLLLIGIWLWQHITKK